MKLSDMLNLRRIINSSYHPFKVIHKPSIWPRRERLMRLTAWQYGSRYLTVKGGYRQLNKVFCYMDIQRQDEPKLEMFHGEERLKAALEEHHAEFPTFRNMMDKAHILLDKKVLSQLAIYEPRTFKSLVDLTQKMALEDGREIVPSEAELAHVQTDAGLFNEPFPHHRVYPKGAAEHHRVKPRKLRVDEF